MMKEEGDGKNRKRKRGKKNNNKKAPPPQTEISSKQTLNNHSSNNNVITARNSSKPSTFLEKMKARLSGTRNSILALESRRLIISKKILHCLTCIMQGIKSKCHIGLNNLLILL